MLFTVIVYFKFKQFHKAGNMISAKQNNLSIACIRVNNFLDCLITIYEILNIEVLTNIEMVQFLELNL